MRQTEIHLQVVKMTGLGKRNLTRIAGALLFVVGLFLMVKNYNSISPEDRDTGSMNKLSSVVIDKIIREESEGDAVRKVHEITVQYGFGGGQKFVKTRAVDENYFNKVYRGDSLMIYADQNNPYHIVMPDSRDEPVSVFNMTFILSLGMIGSGIGLFLYAGRLPAET